MSEVQRNSDTPGERDDSSAGQQPDEDQAGQLHLSPDQLRLWELEWRESHAFNPLVVYGPNRLLPGERDELDGLRGRLGGTPWRGPLLP